jgi:hypothetical protein
MAAFLIAPDKATPCSDRWVQHSIGGLGVDPPLRESLELIPRSEPAIEVDLEHPEQRIL